MTFKEFMYGAFVLPSKVLSGISDLLLGSYQRDNEGKIKTNYKEEELTNRGLFGMLLDVVKYIGINISNFLTNHQQAIASAFWFSALFAGAAALTVFLWPAALTAVATFTIAGYSIASVVGANVIAQIGAVAVLTAIATSATVYVIAGFIHTINFFRECVANGKSAGVKENHDSEENDTEENDTEENDAEENDVEKNDLKEDYIIRSIVEDMVESTTKINDALGGPQQVANSANDKEVNLQHATPLHQHQPTAANLDRAEVNFLEETPAVGRII
jgi:hypothetical protein